MEAEEKPQHRAKAKPCKAGVSGRTCSSTRRPISRDGIEDVLNDNDAMPERSRIVAMRPVKAGGAKGEME